ncbi:MAG TPA: hypothetical protein VGB76_14715, partial [Pyrinomonadaceae bacterium]
FFSEQLEAIQDAIASKHGFQSTHHTLRMFGSCAECQQASRGTEKKEESAAEPRVRFVSAPSTS